MMRAISRPRWGRGFLLPLLALSLLAARAEDLEALLWAAARSGDAQMVEDLLARGADPNAEFRAGGTALLFAAQRGHREVIEVLLAHGAELEATETLNGWRALAWAAFEGHCSVVEALLAHGADPTVKDLMLDQTPLSMAAGRGHAACVDALLASGRLARRAFDESLEIATWAGRTEIAARIDAARQRAEEIPQWPQFRGPGASGVALGAGPPATWSAASPEHLAWKTAIPGLGHSSPIVWGDRLWVTTAVSAGAEPEVRDGVPMESAEDRSPQAWRLLSLDRRSGEILWERTAAEGVPGTKRHPKNSFATSTPATDGDRVVALFGSQGLYCYSLEGELMWRRELGILDAGFFYDPDYQWGSASSPVLYQGLAIVQVDIQEGSFIAAYDLRDGSLRWRTPRDEIPSWATPTVVTGNGHPELVTNATNAIRGYDPLTGEELWRLATRNSFISAATPIAGVGLIFVGNGYRPLKPIYAIRPGATGDITLGEGQTATASVAWSLKSGGPYYTTPLLYGEHLYVLANNGVLSSYYAKSGEQIYRQRVGRADRFSASPVAADGRLYLASEGGEVYVVRAGIEFELLATNPVGEPVMATPAIAGGMIYVRGRHHLFGFGDRGSQTAGAQTDAAASP